MPKHTRSSSSTHNPYAHAMPVSLAPSQPMDIGYNARQQHMSLNTAFYQTMPNNVTAQAAMASQAYEPYPTVPAAAMPQSIPHRASSGAWSPQDDKNLIAARQQGLNWNQIQVNYFPNKTSNACRKRHERLMERKGADDWDARKLERIAREYISMRKEIWQPLAQRVGEKWSVVEARCMNNGLKNIQNAARAGARRERVESGQGQVFTHGYDDDSGISGIGLTPVDDLDASYSSPETTSSGSLSGGSYHGGIPMQLGHQAYNQHYATNTGGMSSGYSSSVSSTTAQAYGQMTGQSHHSSGGSPYLGHGQRLPSVDMGIDAIINRPGGHGGGPSSI
ncbi:myb family transcription factor [Apiospora arundinis]|uniref:Myb family transcription factor n=1 Tax=Apiospora arundinis TaxID=335852 RepID=A0ABR2HQ19_9PEZI